MELAPGSVIDDKYEIIRLLGEGGMGAVFEGRNRLIERRVAIKLLHASARLTEGVVERFEREARAAGRIGGDHILEVLDLGTLPNGDRYMVMEFLDGETLASRIARTQRMTCEQFAPLLRQALVGLSAVHAAGIVHRDLKPDNLFVLREKAGRRDFLKIIDFGVSKFGATGGDMSMTRTGSVMGTPYYMSPEQAKGSSGVNQQSDLYSMGVIAFEALTGAVPFDGTSFNDLMFKIVLSEMPALEDLVPGIDPAFAAIVRRATAKDMNHRYQSATEFLADLDSWAKKRGLRFSGTLSVNPTQETVVSVGPQATPAISSKNVATKSEWVRTGGELRATGRPKTRAIPLAAGAVLALGAAAAAAIWVRSSGSEQPQIEPSATSVSPAPSPLPDDSQTTHATSPVAPPEPPPSKPDEPPGPKDTGAPQAGTPEVEGGKASDKTATTPHSATTARKRTPAKNYVTTTEPPRVVATPPPAPPEPRAEPPKKPPEPAPQPSRAPATPAGRDFGY